MRFSKYLKICQPNSARVCFYKFIMFLCRVITNQSNGDKNQLEYNRHIRNELEANIKFPLTNSPLMMLRTIQGSDYEIEESEIPPPTNVLSCLVYINKER